MHAWEKTNTHTHAHTHPWLEVRVTISPHPTPLRTGITLTPQHPWQMAEEDILLGKEGASQPILGYLRFFLSLVVFKPFYFSPR